MGWAYFGHAESAWRIRHNLQYLREVLLYVTLLEYGNDKKVADEARAPSANPRNSLSLV
jgi:hypothetical protein